MQEGVCIPNSPRGTPAPTWAQSGRLIQGWLPDRANKNSLLS